MSVVVGRGMSSKLGPRGANVVGRNESRGLPCARARRALAPSRRAAACIFAAALHAVALGTSAQAEAIAPARVNLAWQAPAAAGCATPEEIQGRVARLTDRVLAIGAQAPAFRITADVSPFEQSWRARIALENDRGLTLGTRDVQARLPDCHALDVPATLVIATLLDDLHHHEVQSAAAAADSGTRSNRSNVAIGASAASAIGLGKRSWFGGALVVQWPAFGVPVPIEASVYAPVEDLDSRGRGMRSFGFHAGASLCPGLMGGSAVDLRVCFGAQAGGVWGKGVGLTSSNYGLSPLLMVGVEPKLWVAITKGMAAQLSATGHWVAVRPEFDIDIEGEGVRTFESNPFAVTARIGLISFLPW